MELRDKYGGLASASLGATGFFRLEGGGQKWRLVDPEGHPFFIVGMNHIDDSSLKYDENIHLWRERYGCRDKWIQDCVIKSLKEWGFNTLAWTRERVTKEFRHSPEWTPEDFRVAEMPYIPHLDFLSTESWNFQAFYPDVFTSAFEDWCDYQARYWCASLADDPYLIGYACTARPRWTKHPTARPWFSEEELAGPAARKQLREIIRKYFETVHNSIRRYDKNHLILGDLIEGKETAPPGDLFPPQEIFEEMRPYVDVLSINWYDPFEAMADTVAEWQAKTDKPVLLADSGFEAPTELKPDTWNRIHVDTQRERGEAFCDFLDKASSTGYVIGWGWCAFMENKARRRGLMTLMDEPYGECTELMGEYCKDLYHHVMPEVFEGADNG
ncbi:hypothetical protein ACFL1X_04445 [Candidatus Hydrogenedentota bacterium]